MGKIYNSFSAAIFRLSVNYLNSLVFASSDKNYEGIELGNITIHTGNTNSAPGTIKKNENGMNLIKSLFTYLILASYL